MSLNERVYFKVIYGVIIRVVAVKSGDVIFVAAVISGDVIFVAAVKSGDVIFVDAVKSGDVILFVTAIVDVVIPDIVNEPK